MSFDQKDARRNRKSIPCSLREGIVRVSSLLEFRFRFPAFLPSSSQSQLVNGISLPPCPSGIVGFSKNRVQARSTLIVFSRMASSNISFISGHVVYVLKRVFLVRAGEACNYPD